MQGGGRDVHHEYRAIAHLHEAAGFLQAQLVKALGCEIERDPVAATVAAQRSKRSELALRREPGGAPPGNQHRNDDTGGTERQS